ncbi:MAG: YncE family protein, partial [Nocardiopsaceae bacterium]|nr:YncE family protein [Nocardiopsaceae bacterium]
AAGIVLAAGALAACSSGGHPPHAAKAAAAGPQQIIPAPKGLRAAAQPQTNGTMWALAGDQKVMALFDFSLTGGTQHLIGSRPVSNSARSVAESLSGVLGVALGTPHSGALELLDGATGTVKRTIPLGAPARQVVVGSDGSTFYVLNGNSRSASVTVVNSGNDKLLGTVPVPLDTVSIAPALQQSTIYALQPDGTVSQIATAGGQVQSSFTTGASARSLALSPDGSTLYVLKGDPNASNIAVVNTATQAITKVLPAPANSKQILISANGHQLYQMAGTAGYGNIQVTAS